MDFGELLKFIELQDKRLRDQFIDSSERERVLARTVKLMEELGELCDEILASGGDQRDEKLANRDGKNLSNEFADVVITTLLLAKSAGIDIGEALESKIKKINERYTSKEE